MMRWSLPVLNCLVENTGSSKVTIGLSLLRRQCCHTRILRPGVASKPSAFLCLLYPLPRWVSGSGPCILQVEIQSETMDRRVPRGRGGALPNVKLVTSLIAGPLGQLAVGTCL